MGERGPLKKTAAKRQGHRGRGEARTARTANAELVAIDGGRSIEPPPPPEGLSDKALRAWAAFWSDDVALSLSPASMPLLYRLFPLYDRLDKAWEITDLALTVRGSQGQIRVNPLAKHAKELEALVLRLESELGMTPMARARLGLTMAQGQLTVDEINRRAREGSGKNISAAEARQLKALGFEAPT